MYLTKHHGLGNDFLIVVDRDGEHPIDGEMAAAVCDRHRGIGADGLIRVSRGTERPFRMELYNEDGSRAEMSGNGISCMAQAVRLAGFAANGVVDCETDAGPRCVTLVHEAATDRHTMRVAMGTPKVVAPLPEWEDDRVLGALHVDVGNPHVVCHIADLDDPPDLVSFGERINKVMPGGANVELIFPGDPGMVVMSVYERGVGPTLACGTGAVAAAAAAHEWELAPTQVTVSQPGGAALVELGDPAHLTLPVKAIGRVEWPW